MELAEPSIATAFARCVEQGATLVVVVPYFLAPGKHWHEDIPRLAAEAAAPHAGVDMSVAPPLGLHPLMLEVIDERIAEALGRQHDGDWRSAEFCRLRRTLTPAAILPIPRKERIRARVASQACAAAALDRRSAMIRRFAVSLGVARRR